MINVGVLFPVAALSVIAGLVIGGAIFSAEYARGVREGYWLGKDDLTEPRKLEEARKVIAEMEKGRWA